LCLNGYLHSVRKAFGITLLNKTRTAPEIWEAALGELQVQVSRSNFRTWFERTTGLSREENTFVIGVPNTFVAEYLDRNQRSLIEKALAGLTSPEVQVEFRVNGRYHRACVDDGARFTSPSGNGSGSLNPRYVFDSFVEGTSNQLARSAALAVAREPGKTYNPLFIYGGVGLGKTHLLHAIGHMAEDRHMKVLCVSAEKFTNEYVTAIRDRKMEAFHQKYRSAGMLLVDDIQFINGKEQTEETFFHTFNELHNANQQIAITSDRPPRDFSSLAERLRSRFEWGLIVDIQSPEFETRMAILQKKAKEKQVSVPNDVLEFVARQELQNIRELEGSLNRVIALARLFHREPDVPLAAKALENLSGKSPVATAPASQLILNAVAECFELSPDRILSQQRDKETSEARRVAMYLVRQETGLPLAKIGQEMGGRDAAAVAKACQKVSADISSNRYLKRKITDILQNINKN